MQNLLLKTDLIQQSDLIKTHFKRTGKSLCCSTSSQSAPMMMISSPFSEVNYLLWFKYHYVEYNSQINKKFNSLHAGNYDC